MKILLPVIASFIVIFLAELGDKTQLLTLVFSSRYGFKTVFAGVFCATALLMAIAVFLGTLIFSFIPELFVQLFAGGLFLVFGFLSMFSGEEDEEEEQKRSGTPFLIVFLSFFVAELGDKTQLATFALSAKYGAPVLVWLGATLGMVLANLLALVAGNLIKDRVSDKAIKWGGGIIFILFGLITLISLIWK